MSVLSISDVATNRTVPAEPAGLRRRIQAFLLDYVLILGYLALLAAVFVPLSRGALRKQLSSLSPLGGDLLAFVTTILPVTLYFAIGDASRKQGSWGKQRKGLRVQTVDGRRLGFGRSLLRSALKFLPWQISHTVLFNWPGFPTDPQPSPVTYAGFGLVYALIGANLLSAWRTRRGQALYDLATGTEVVRGQGSGVGDHADPAREPHL